MSDILRQLTANLIPTVSGGAYLDAREVSIVWNTRRKHRFLPKFRCRMHQTRPSTLFSPVFSLAREKMGPPEARQKRPRRNEPPQATSLILCARFFLSKPQTEFAVWVLSQICDNLSVSLRLTAPLKGEPGVRAHSQCLPLCEEKPLSAAAGFNPSVAFGASSLYAREPWGAREKSLPFVGRRRKGLDGMLFCWGLLQKILNIIRLGR